MHLNFASISKAFRYYGRRLAQFRRTAFRKFLYLVVSTCYILKYQLSRVSALANLSTPLSRKGTFLNISALFFCAFLLRNFQLYSFGDSTRCTLLSDLRHDSLQTCIIAVGCCFLRPMRTLNAFVRRHSDLDSTSNRFNVTSF